MGDLSGNVFVITPEGNPGASSENNENAVPAHRSKLKELLAIPGLWNQVYAALALSVAAFVSGIVEGWPGSMSLKLIEPETSALFDENKGPDHGRHVICNGSDCSHPIVIDHRPHIIDNGEISVIFFYMLLSALIHMIITGALMDNFGRKAGCWFLIIVLPFGWVFLATAGSLTHLYIGAALIGSVAVSGEVVGVVYISETSNDRIRGPLISLLMFFNSLGMLTAHILGEELNFDVFHYICLLLTCSFPFFLWGLPESPQFLMLKSRVEEATESVTWFHGNDPIIVDLEIKKLRQARRFDMVECKTLLTSLSNRKAILIVMSLSALTELAGTSLVEVFAGSTIAQIHQAHLSAKIASMFLASCRFIGGILNVYFVEKAGRKRILVISLLAMAISLSYLWVFFFVIVSVDQSPPAPKATFNHMEIMKDFLISHINTTNSIVLEKPNTDEAEVEGYFQTVSFVFVIFSMKYTFYIATVCLVIYTLANQMFLGTSEVISGEILAAETKGVMMSCGGLIRISTLLICILIYNSTLKIDVFGTWSVLLNAVGCYLGAYFSQVFMPETQGKTLNEIHREFENPKSRCDSKIYHVNE